MASLHPVVILFLPLFTFYVQFAGAGETPLGCPCNAETECKTLHSNCSFTYGMKDNISGCPTRSPIIGDDHTTTPRGTDKVIRTCLCADAFYWDSNNKCSHRNHPNEKCATNKSCVDNSYCNKSGVCECLNNYKPTSNSTKCTCISTSSSDSSSPTVLPTVLKRTTAFTDKGHGKPNYEISGSTVQTKVQTTVETSTPGLKATHFDSSSTTVKNTVQMTPPDNSAATTTVVEISAIIMSFMLAYFAGSK